MTLSESLSNPYYNITKPRNISPFANDFRNFDWTNSGLTEALTNNKTNKNKTSKLSSLLAPLLGSTSMAVPLLGLGLGLAGTLSDYSAKKERERQLQEAQRQEEERRNYYENVYNTGRTKDMAERDLLRQGQGAFSPIYRQRLSDMANNRNIENQALSNRLRRGGDIGLRGQGISQYLQNTGYNNQIGNLNKSLTSMYSREPRTYNPSINYVTSRDPELTNFNYQKNQYNGINPSVPIAQGSSVFGQGFNNRRLSDILGDLRTSFNNANK